MPNIAILGHVWQRHNWTSYPPRSLCVRRYFAFYHVMSLWFVIGRVLNFSLGKTNSRCFVDRFVSFGINRWRFIWMKNVYEHKDKEYAYIMWFATVRKNSFWLNIPLLLVFIVISEFLTYIFGVELGSWEASCEWLPSVLLF